MPWGDHTEPLAQSGKRACFAGNTYQSLRCLGVAVYCCELVVAGEMTATQKKKTKRDPWSPPLECIGYTLCPHSDSCIMAGKYLSYVWDFGPGSKPTTSSVSVANIPVD